MYLQVIEEFRAYDRLSGDRNESEFSSALEKGFRRGGWKAAETKAVKTPQVRRKTSYASPFLVATLYAAPRPTVCSVDPQSGAAAVAKADIC